MGVMTTHAVHHRCLYAEVRLGKGRLGIIVALFAADSHLRGKQGRGCRIMWLVAVEAVLLRRIMRFLLIHFFLDILVTGITEPRPLGYEQILELGLVGVMAHGTIPLAERGMPGSRLLEPLVGFVAAGADLQLGLRQHTGGIAAVGIVAGHAFTGLEGFMIGSAAFTLHHLRVAAAAEFRTGGLEQLDLGSGVPLMAGQTLSADHRLVGIGFFEPGFRIRVAGITEPVDANDRHAGEVGAVRVVTCLAFTGLERVMYGLAFQAVFGFGVAIIAQIGAFPVYQPLERGCVRLVAGKAALGVTQRSMPVGNLLRHAFVATRAEGIAAKSCQPAVFGGMRIMAAQAIAALEGRVLNHAACRERLDFMALQAERGTLLIDGKRIGGAWRGMATIAASGGNRAVNAFLEQFRLV